MTGTLELTVADKSVAPIAPGVSQRSDDEREFHVTPDSAHGCSSRRKSKVELTAPIGMRVTLNCTVAELIIAPTGICPARSKRSIARRISRLTVKPSAPDTIETSPP